MDKEEFKVLVKGMKAVYSQPTFIPDQDAFNVWYSLINDLTYEVCNVAIQKYMLANKYPPTIADIRELATTVRFGELPNWSESWENVIRAIRRYGSYNEAEALNSLDDLTRQAVIRLGFRNLCMSENIAVERANFRMIYEQLAERLKDKQNTPLQLQQTIDLLLESNRMMLEGGNNGKLL